MKVYGKAILPRGFAASGFACGIKKAGDLDLALFYSDTPAKAACKFTANTIAAAPVIISKKYLKESRNFKAIIVNSGNANCFTGSAGLRDAEETALSIAEALGIGKKEVLVGSTGIIGKRLPLSKIKACISKVADGLSAAGINKAKRAIMTTDTFPKEITVKFDIAGKSISVCGIAKGAGMIAPNMATMLAFIFTDANITGTAFKKALDLSVENSFNCITVDGCMSTNDSVMALANAAAGNALISGGRNLALFSKALETVCLELAKMIVRDAEGATKFIRIKIREAKSYSEAKKIALSIANSSLFKTAVYGQNPNFGRIAAAVGATGVDVKEKDLKIKVSPLFRKNIEVDVCVGRGNYSVVIYTSDLTCEYVKINAEYN